MIYIYLCSYIVEAKFFCSLHQHTSSSIQIQNQDKIEYIVYIKLAYLLHNTLDGNYI